MGLVLDRAVPWSVLELIETPLDSGFLSARAYSARNGSQTDVPVFLMSFFFFLTEDTEGWGGVEKRKQN